MATNKEFNLLDIATISDKRVKKFDGLKQYVATADIDLNQIIGGELVSYSDKPSRADLLMGKEDVLFAKMKNTVKVLCGSPDVEDKIFSTGFYILTPNDSVSAKYLYFYFLSDGFNQQKNAYCTGATMAAIGNSGVRKIKVSLPVDSNGNPDIKEQNRIVSLFEEAEDLKKKRSEADQKMSEIIPALFDRMFGHPLSNEKKWDTGVLGDVIYSAKDGPHVSPKYSDENGIPFFSSRHVKPGKIIWDDLRYISRDEAEIQWRKCKPEKGDVLYTKGGTTGIAAAIEFDTPIAIWVHIALLKVIHEKVNPIWLETMLNTDFCYKQSQELTHGIANRDLGLNRMKTIKIFIPPLKLQNEFVEKIETIRDLERKQNKSSEQIGYMFNSLLAKI